MWFEITHSVAPLVSQKNFDPSISISTLKDKLYMLCGTAPQFQQLQLVDVCPDGTTKVLHSNLDDNKTLADYNVMENIRIHIVDVDPMKTTSSYYDTSSVTKYTISDEAYDQRDDTFRKWKQKNIEQSKTLGQSSENGIKEGVEEEMIKDMKTGQRCEIQNSALKQRGEVKYIGKIAGRKGYWVGVQLDEPYGDSNGIVNGKTYFKCGNKYGIFVKPSNLLVGDFPERDLLLEDEDEI